MSREKIVAIFDFDKTLTVKDSFRVFSLAAADSPWEKLSVFVLAVFCKLGVIDNRRYKAQVLEKVWCNRTEEQKSRFLVSFQSRLRHIENPPIMQMLRQHLENLHTVAVISASPEFYLKPYIQSLSEDILVFGTTIHIVDGQLAVENLYGEEKEMHARKLIRNHQPSSVVVYVDDISDLSVMKLATRVRLVAPSSRCIRALEKRAIQFEIVQA